MGLGQAAQELFDVFPVGAGVGEVRHDVVGAGDDPQVGVRLGGVEFVGHGGGVVGVGSAVDEQDGNSGAGDGVEGAGLGEAVPGEHPAHLAGQGQDEAGGQVPGAKVVETLRSAAKEP